MSSLYKVSGTSPILVSGIGRSGTSILFLSLMQHKSVLNPLKITEAPFLQEFINFLYSLCREDDYGKYLEESYVTSIEERQSAYAEMLRRVLFKYSDQKEGATFFPCKATMVDETAWKMLLSVFPGTKAVYIVRNGIEVVNSSINFEPFAGAGFTSLCKRWAEYSIAFSYLERSHGAGVLYHHEMTKDPRRSFRGLFEKIGLEQDDTPAEHVESNFLNSSFEESGNFSLKDRLDAAWSSWNEEQRVIFNRTCGSEMERHGFSLLPV